MQKGLQVASKTPDLSFYTSVHFRVICLKKRKIQRLTSFQVKKCHQTSERTGQYAEICGNHGKGDKTDLNNKKPAIKAKTLRETLMFQRVMKHRPILTLPDEKWETKAVD